MRRSNLRTGRAPETIKHLMMTTGTYKMPPKGHLANNGHLYDNDKNEGEDRDIQAAMNEETSIYY